jgi:hypothetical protein
MNCFCEVLGTVTGVKNDNPRCNERIKEPGRVDTKDGPVMLARFRPIFNDGDRLEWPNGEYQVILEGDQVLGDQEVNDPKRGKIHPGVDADHMGPGLQNPDWFPPKPNVRIPTGDGIEGGQFLSGFAIVDR